ncbi:MAG: hypothetical protein JSS82_00125 [Bacteroidetes bacterium]|nr:hypothetical protein [Bacteroidota bacterium]
MEQILASDQSIVCLTPADLRVKRKRSSEIRNVAPFCIDSGDYIVWTLFDGRGNRIDNILVGQKSTHAPNNISNKVAQNTVHAFLNKTNNALISRTHAIDPLEQRLTQAFELIVGKQGPGIQNAVSLWQKHMVFAAPGAYDVGRTRHPKPMHFEYEFHHHNQACGTDVIRM